MANQGGSREHNERAGKQSQKSDDMKRGQQGGGMGGSRQQSGENFGDKQQGGQRGGSGNFANDPKKASEAGRKGGQS